MKFILSSDSHLWRNAEAALALASLLVLPARTSGSEREILQGHVPPAVARLKLQTTGRLPATNQLRLAIGLPLRNTNQLNQLLLDLYDPASPQFRHYLSLDRFTERFGPTKEDYEAVRRFALQHGLAVANTYPNRVVLDVTGQVSDIEQAFQITLNTYQHPTEQRAFYAPAAEPSVDAGLPVLDISGLDNFAVPHRATHRAATAGTPYLGGGSGPGGNLMGKDYRNAYAPGVSFTGKGQVVGLVEFQGYTASDATVYEDLTGLPHVPLQEIRVSGFDGSNPYGSGPEAVLDIEMAVAMAPGLDKVVVFDAGGGGHWPDVASAMVTNQNIKQFSSSWAFAASGRTTDQIFEEMAAQGQSFFQASGDAGCWNNDPAMWLLINNDLWPCDSSYVTSVGGTSLTMKGGGAAYASETVWNDGYVQSWGGGAGAGSGGGISATYPIPPWQKGLDMTASHGSATKRNYPDVAMNAEENNAIVFNGSISTGWGGTSFAAPLWAGFAALVNEAASANGQPPMGFLNPALYALGQSANYTNSFHDITVGNNDVSPIGPVQFPAVPGYDLCTGWGTPKGSNLIYALALPEALVVTPGSAAIFTNLAGGPVNPDTLSFSLTNRRGSLLWAAGLDVPWLTVSPTNGTLTAAGPAVVVTVALNPLAANLAPGIYTAHLWFTNLNDQSVQTSPVSLAVAGPPAITSQPAAVTVSLGMTAIFAVQSATNALLSYQWQVNNGSSTNNLADTGNFSGATTPILTISSVALADAGTYSVIVSNLAGAVTSAGASLTVLTGQPPAVISQPTNETLLPGATATFSVTGDGDPPLVYFWQFNGTNLANGGNISGAGSSTLTVANVTAASAGGYSAVIANSFGAVTSTVAALTISAVTAPGVNLQTLYSFAPNAYGVYPFGALLQANDGNFYGTARGGGVNGAGTVFRWKPNGVIGLVHAFTFDLNGSIPYSGLIQATNGFLYGTASMNGWPYGTVFRTTTSGAFSAYSLDPFTSGSGPMGALVQGLDGNLYGTASSGGADQSGTQGVFAYGTVFKMTPSGTITALGTFNSENGANPESTLVQAADGTFYGTATAGGTNGGFGTLFKITPAGSLTALFSFGKTNGAQPIAGLTEDADGSFYGTTYAGGAHNSGTVFKLAPDGTFKSLYSFTGGADGSNCYGGLLLASDGNLYGTTEGGGAYGLGTVFQISRSGILTKLLDFDGYQGATPEGTLIQGTDSTLYGTTQFGGAGNFGTIFSITLSGALQITQQPQGQTAYAGNPVQFSVVTFGGLPVSYQWLRDGTNLVDGGDVLGSGTRILTLTNVSSADAATYSVLVSNSFGGVSSVGAVLQINESAPVLVSQPQSLTVLEGATALLSVGATGSGPLYFQWQQNGVNLADGGNLSGSATPTLTLAPAADTNAGTYSVVINNSSGSVTSSPAVLTVLPVSTPSASLRDVLPFTSARGGSFNPYAGVIQGTDGNFYGTTLKGGTEGFGSLFRLSPYGGYATLHSFTNGTDGAAPLAGLVQAKDGNFYGASSASAGAPFGALFRLTPAGSFTSLYSFGGGSDGGNPIGSLVQGTDGNLYGTASTGGSNGFGTAYGLSTSGVFTPLWSFRSIDGSSPAGPLVQGSQGNLYGTTTLGGNNNLGTIFSLNTNGALASLASFDYTAGAYPSNGLVLAADGSLYGTASGGGTNGGWGTVFRLAPDGSLTALHSFNYEDGAVPVGGLVQGLDGNLYGTTSQGGRGGEGTVFQITTNGLLTTLFWFNATNGANPQSTLIQASDGLFYGTAEFGGSQYEGAHQTGDGLVFGLVFDPLVISPAAGFNATGPMGGPFSPATQTFVLTNTGSTSLPWSAITTPGSWLAAAPTNGVLAPHTTTSVTVSLGGLSEILGTGFYATNLAFTNWRTRVSQSEPFTLHIGPNIVQNGGFETGDFTGWTLVGHTNTPGYFYNVVTNSTYGYDVAHSGTYGVLLGDTELASLSQRLPTSAGQRYLLSFWLFNTVAGTVQQFLAQWSGITLYHILDPPAFDWTNLQFIVTASGSSTLLEFWAQNDPSFFSLDDISVTPIPTVAFQSAIAGPTSFSLSWFTASGLTYQVQSTTNLAQPNWVNLGAPIVATGFPLTITDTNSIGAVPQKFYRLVVSP